MDLSRSLDSSIIGIVTKLRPEWPKNFGSTPGRNKRSFSSPKRPDRLWSPHYLLFSGYRGLVSRR